MLCRYMILVFIQHNLFWQYNHLNLKKLQIVIPVVNNIITGCMILFSDSFQNNENNTQKLIIIQQLLFSF